MECQKVRNKDAAKLLGMSVSRMHALMDRKRLDIGVVIQPLPGMKNRSYEVYKNKLYKHLGLEGESAEQKMQADKTPACTERKKTCINEQKN